MKRDKGVVPGLGQVTPPASLTHTAKDALKRAIIKGELTAGSVYSEQAVAGQMGISKTPVHNALLELESKGFVSILPRRGFVVNRFTRQELVELFEYRRALECAVVANLAGSLTPEERIELEALVAEHQSNDDPSEFISLDRRFHEKMAELSGNRYIIESLSNIWDLVEWLGVNSLRNAISSGPGSTATEMNLPRQEHQAMLTAICHSDPAKAQEAVLKHLRRVEKRYLGMWEDLDLDPAEAGPEK
jgi:DNA-binding GntR family transcriptional regulator